VSPVERVPIWLMVHPGKRGQDDAELLPKLLKNVKSPVCNSAVRRIRKALGKEKYAMRHVSRFKSVSLMLRHMLLSCYRYTRQAGLDHRPGNDRKRALILRLGLVTRYRARTPCPSTTGVAGSAAGELC